GAGRGDAAPPAAVLALRPLLHLRARRGAHRQRALPRPLRGGVSLLRVLRARRPPLARGPLMALTRAARSWSQLVLQVLLLLTGLGLLQVVAERTNHRFDLTPGRELSLSPVTQKLLAEVKDPLRITVFFRRGTKEQYAQLLERLCVQNRQVEFELYDLDRYPDRARTLGVTQYGRAAIEYAGRRTVAPALPEEELAGGILRALRGKARRIAFTTGHGERAPGGGPESYGRLAGALAAENYVAEGHSLLDGPVPPETDLVVVAGPQHDFLLPELDELARYLKGGGGVLLFLDPAPLPN